MSSGATYSTWVEIDLSAIENNVRWFCSHSQAQVMAIVKAYAYGHGALQVAQAALRAGASWCGVARIEEALELRDAGLDCPILLLGFVPEARMEEAIANQVSITVWEQEQVEQAAAAAIRNGLKARLHLKIDTGMSRIGVQAEDAVPLAANLAKTPGVIFEGAFTHFACADEADPAQTTEQERVFQGVLSGMEAAGARPGLVHAANSAASLARPSAHYHLMRTGIAMYGLHPSRERRLPGAFRPALSWKTVLSHVKTLPSGRGVSYGHTYRTAGRERLGTLPVGYADGFRRTAGNRALVCGQPVPVVGRVCMDQAVVQLDSAPGARPGDEVVLLGAQGDACISAEDIAQTWGTINYEVVCGIGRRVPRVYR